MRLFILALIPAVFMSACISDPVKYTEQIPVAPSRLPAIERVESTPQPELVSLESDVENDTNPDPFGLFRKRSQIPSNYNKYEGSLWNGDSSFGNFLRGKRAMSQGDLLKVVKIQSNITKFDEEPAVNQDSPNATLANAVAEDATSDVTSLFKIGEAERLKVHESIDSMVVKIVQIGSNGLMAVYGEKLQYKDSNNIRFRSSLKGFIRSEDIGDDNTISADLMQNFDFQTERKIKLTDVYKQKIIESLNKAENLTTGNTDATKDSKAANAQNTADIAKDLPIAETGEPVEVTTN